MIGWACGLYLQASYTFLLMALTKPFSFTRSNSFPLNFLLKLDFDSAAPPEQAWRRKLNSHAGILKEFSVTFMEAIKMGIILSM